MRLFIKKGDHTFAGGNLEIIMHALVIKSGIDGKVFRQYFEIMKVLPFKIGIVNSETSQTGLSVSQTP